jgi:hypothetical protein
MNHPTTNAWNKIFMQQGRVFTEPHEDMPRIVRLLKDRQMVQHILEKGI